MTDMTLPMTCMYRPAVTLALLLVTSAGIAQEAAEDDLMPAVDTSATTPERDSSPDTVLPAPAAELSDEVARRTSGSEVMDSIELGRTEITGNQELPKVLYIVPWQKSDPGDLMGRPVNSLLDEVLAPIDREEFVRQVDYYGEIYGEEEQE
ncbi:MAG: hypothetical protein HKN64_00360 [Woeseiaceae bacterium]|nr:hypothetical protein [Woeseiaceae bacterium]